MEIAQHIDALAAEADLFVAAMEAAGPDAPVPTCPDWRVRDLVLHLGGVHRWAALHVREARTELVDEDLATLVGVPGPRDADLAAWFREGHAQLVADLRAAPPDLRAFTFLKDVSSPLAFWARRQLHETTIHRVDAESAAGTLTPPTPTVADDGVDELLTGFITRRSSRFRLDPARTFAVHASDTGGIWSVRVGPDAITTERATSPSPDPKPDVSVEGAAADLYLFLWNRADSSNLTASGDESLLARWTDQVKVGW